MYRWALVLPFVASVAVAASAATLPIAVVPQITGARMHVTLVRTTQGTTGPLAVTSTFDLVRRGGGAFALERPQPNGAPNVAVLTQKKDGTLALGDDARALGADLELAAIVDGLNVAIAAMHGADASNHGAWTTGVPVPSVAYVPAANPPLEPTAIVAFLPANITPSGYDFAGDGQTTGAAAPTRDRSQESQRGRGFGGGMPGRGRGRGAEPGEAQGAPAYGGATPATTIAVHVDGHIAGSRLDRIAIAQTRSIVVGGMPFVNQTTWTMTVGG
jgi:hypothetical protein